MTYPEALKYLNSLVNYEKKTRYGYKISFNLDRMKTLASFLGNPQDETRSIHIAGTKGKGSTAAFVHSILQSAGFRVGLYTSPHLVSFRERIRINNELISEDDIGRILEEVMAAIDGFGDLAPSLFEVYTAIAYLYFKENKIDFAVYEVGLGGRLDATNIIEPLVSAITSISYEHMDKLGGTLKEIASEKAGIIKDDGICVMAPQEKEAEGAIEDIINARGARLIRVGSDIRSKEISATDRKETFSVFGLYGEYPLLETGLLGSHQVINATTAIGIIEALRLKGVKIGPDAIREGIGLARWEGRLEVVGTRPFMVLDGAQNRASAGALAAAIRRSFRYKRLILILGVSKDKDIKGMLEELLPISDSVILTKSKVAERAMEPARIRRLINSEDKDVVLTSNVEEALNRAYSAATPDDMVLITGSLFVAGEARAEIMGCGYYARK